MAGQEPDLQRKRAAYHEAGHVIANLVLGHRFRIVTIRSGEPDEEVRAVHGITRGRAKDLAVIQLAGIAASAKMTGCDPYETTELSEDDRADIATADIFIDNWVSFLKGAYGEAPYRQQIREETEHRTRELVDRNGKAIEVVAEALLLNETLSFDEVTRILKDRCPEFSPEKPPGV